MTEKLNIDCVSNDEISFFKSNEHVIHSEHRLPHWQQNDTSCFVTFRLADSLPRNVLRQWHWEEENWKQLHPKPWDEETEEKYYQIFSERIGNYLDRGTGSCALKSGTVASIVRESLEYFDGDRYRLYSYVIVPNHVHILFSPIDPHSISEIVKSWKSFSARKINMHLGEQGKFWQEDYFDRLIRSERHFLRCLCYIRNNPLHAKLKKGEYYGYLSEKLIKGGRVSRPAE